jgi:hypothetical protein
MGCSQGAKFDAFCAENEVEGPAVAFRRGSMKFGDRTPGCKAAQKRLRISPIDRLFHEAVFGQHEGF